MKRLLPLLLFIILISCTGEMIGTISIKGNEPHTFLAFTTEKGDVYKVEGPIIKELREKYQGARLKLKGKPIKKKESGSYGPGIIEVDEIVKVYKN